MDHDVIRSRADVRGIAAAVALLHRPAASAVSRLSQALLVGAGVAAGAALAPAAQADSLYLCKAYSGGSFWSREPCGQHQALIERIVSVPDGLSLQQQVRLGEQARAEGQRLAQSPGAAATGQAPRGSGKPSARTQGAKAAPDHSTECAALQSRVDKLDAQAHQAQSGTKQDKLTEQRRKLREKQARAGC
jgi:hypothetical protein